MSLSPDQKMIVGTWVAAGASLSEVQKRLNDEFKVNMTYMDVRFLVDDLNLELKDPAPKKAQADAQAAPAADKGGEKKGFFDKMKEKVGLGSHNESADIPAEESLDEDMPADELEPDAVPPQGGGVTVSVDKIVLIPGAVASGSVTFSDGVIGKWIIDQYGRPGFTEISQPGYRPSASDAQAFMRELTAAIQGQQGF